MSDSVQVRVTVNRDSVCAGDDMASHEAGFFILPSSSALDLIHNALQACPLASIAGGRATWLIGVGGSSNCIGVMAQQWDKPKLLIPLSTTVADLLLGQKPSLYFRYWCQIDPDAVFSALQSGGPLPSKYSQ